MVCVFGRFDLAALCGCHTLNVCFFVYDFDDLAELLANGEGVWQLSSRVATPPARSAGGK